MAENITRTPGGLKERLKQVTALLLNPVLDYTAVRNACASLSSFFCDVSGFDMNDRKNQDPISTPAGNAISPYGAAACVTDMMRTRNFLQGIREAVDTRLKANPGKPVTVLYAGTGPFATLLLPLTTVFTPQQLQLVLIEINSISIGYLQKIIQQLQLQTYVIDVVKADASVYTIPGNHQPDILVSETMKAGLLKEPYVSIVANLIVQCARNPILIPESVKVGVCLTGNIAMKPDAIHSLQTLLELDAVTAAKIKSDPQSMDILSGGVSVTIPEGISTSINHLTLNTRIRVYKNHRLGLNECGLTILQKIMDVSVIKNLPSRLLFRYQTDKEPYFHVTEL